jgi:hypothetical protein
MYRFKEQASTVLIKTRLARRLCPVLLLLTGCAFAQAQATMAITAWSRIDTGPSAASVSWRASSDGRVSVSGAPMAMGVRSFYVGGPESEGDYTLRCRFTRQRPFDREGLMTAPFGVAVRFRDERNYYGIAFHPRGEAVIERMRDGVMEILATVAAHAPQEIENYLDVTARKDTITVRLNGHVIVRARDRGHVAGRVGLFVAGGERIQFHEVGLYHPGSMPMEGVPLLMVKAPYVVWAAGERAVVLWETNRPATATVTYAIPGSREERSVQTDGRARMQRAVLGGLEPGAHYGFRVSIEGRNRGGGVFHADTGAGNPFSAAFTGNTWTRPDRVEAMNALILAHAPHFAIHLGNMVERGDAQDAWDAFFFHPGRQVLGQTPVYAAVGARDQWPTRHGFNRYFPYPGAGIETQDGGESSYFAFRYGDAAFLFLDSYFPYAQGSLQYAWAEAKLSSAEFQEAAWRIVVSHAGPYRVERGRWVDGAPGMQAQVLPMCARHGVQLWVSGESPTYKTGRDQGVVLVMNGGGGAGNAGQGYAGFSQFFDRVLGHVTLQYSIMRVDADRLEWSCYTPGNALLDHFVIEK